MQGSYDLIHARILHRFPELVLELGGKPAALLADIGLEPHDCARSGVVTVHQWVLLLRRTADCLGAADFGLRLAQRQGGREIYGALGTAMRNTHQFGEALSFVTKHSAAHSSATRVWMGHSHSGRHRFVGHDILVGSLAERCQAVEHVLLLGHLGASALTAGSVRARRVHLRHRALSPASTYRAHFGCDVRFCRNEDGLVFATTDLARPISDPDGDAFRQATALVDRLMEQEGAPFAAQVRGVLMQRLAAGACGNNDVAEALKMHPRSLHRRLRAEGTSFQQVKDAVRRETMLYYLRETDLDLARISEKLGFAEQSALSHFARSHCGASPRDLRGSAAPMG